MRKTTWLPVAVLSFFPAADSVAQHEHGHEQTNQKDDSQTFVVTGKLVDSTWFLQSDGKPTDHDPVARASANLAGGIPAAVIPDGTADEKNVWVLLTNPTVLAPYAGKRVKIEGQSHREMRAIAATICQPVKILRLELPNGEPTLVLGKGIRFAKTELIAELEGA